MNKDIKLNWDTRQKIIALAKALAPDYDMEKLKQIKTLEEFLTHEKLPEWLGWYAVKFNKGRIEAFEVVIATSIVWSEIYCFHVAECRIPAMWETIRKGGLFWERYLRLPKEVKQ